MDHSPLQKKFQLKRKITIFFPVWCIYQLKINLCWFVLQFTWFSFFPICLTSENVSVIWSATLLFNCIRYFLLISVEMQCKPLTFMRFWNWHFKLQQHMKWKMIFLFWVEYGAYNRCRDNTDSEHQLFPASNMSQNITSSWFRIADVLPEEEGGALPTPHICWGLNNAPTGASRH